MNDAEAFAYYDATENREPPAGTPRRRLDRGVTKHLPVRLPRETIERVKRLADAEGVTASAWVRLAVDEKVRQHNGDEHTQARLEQLG